MLTTPKEQHPLLTEEPPRRAMAFRLASASASASKGRRRRRRAKMSVARLGGERRLRLRGGQLVMLGALLLRRLRLRWLAVQYRRLRSYYARLLRDMIDAAADADAVRARIVMDSYYAALPVATTSF